MNDAHCRYLIEVSAKAFSRKYWWDQFAQDTCEQFYPIRADYTTTLTYDDFAGWLSDGYPVRSRETLGTTIDAMLRQGEWFKFSTGDDARDKRPANASVLKRLTQRMRNVIYDKRSNWDLATGEADQDWVSVGNPVLSVEESATRDYIVYRSWHPRDCAWLCDENGKPDTMFRKFRMTARNIRRKIERGAWAGPLPPEVQRASEREPSREFNLMHVLMPTDGLYGDEIAELKRQKKPFLSIYIDLDNQKYLNEAGANVWNYVVPRQRVFGDKPWGFSVYTMNGLQDAKMLQDMKLVVLEQGQKAVDPPIVGSSSIFSRDLNLFAGGFTEVDLEPDQKLGDAMEVLDTGQRLNVGLELIADVKAGIAESLLLNKLMLPTLRDMREVEVMVRTEEFRRAALPFFKPIESQYHEPLLSVTFQMMMNMRMIEADEIPRELQGQEITWKFTSPLNEAEGREVLDKFYSGVQVIAAASEVDQTVGNLFDIRKAATDAMIALDRPEWLKPEDQREEANEEADITKQLGQAADIAQRGAGVTADMANASMAAQQAGML